jgi:CDP-diacylglycerol--glycerol-3-phosphate 3-phosphatidyltransferase
MLQQWKTPANIVTMVRIVLVVVFIVMTVMAGPSGYYNLALRWASAVLFIVAATTDKIDGYLARSRNEVTDLGKLLDPIADKLLICSALVVLSVFAELYWWVTILFLIREVGITLLRFFVIDKMNLVIAASQSGKLKTVLETIAISMFLVPMWIFDPQGEVWTNYYYIAAFVMMILALEMCLWSGGEYLYNVYRTFKKQKAEQLENGSTPAALIGNGDDDVVTVESVEAVEEDGTGANEDTSADNKEIGAKTDALGKSDADADASVADLFARAHQAQEPAHAEGGSPADETGSASSKEAPHTPFTTKD